MELYLIRHGESVGNQKKIIQGQIDYPLSPLGIEQAKKLAAYFQTIDVDAIYSSGLSRAYVTAETLAKAKHLPVNECDHIREIKLGPFQGKTRREIEDLYPEVKSRSLLTSGVEGTESVADITKRCSYVLAGLKEKHANDTIALVSHGGFIGIFLMYMMIGENWETFHRPFYLSNTGVTLVKWKVTEKPMFEYVNNTAHLQIPLS